MKNHFAVDGLLIAEPKLSYKVQTRAVQRARPPLVEHLYMYTIRNEKLAVYRQYSGHENEFYSWKITCVSFCAHNEADVLYSDDSEPPSYVDMIVHVT